MDIPLIIASVEYLLDKHWNISG